MPYYEVEWSQNQKPWIIHTTKKTAIFVEGLLSQALDVGNQITIKVISKPKKGENHGPTDR